MQSNDEYFVLKDFTGYMEAFQRLNKIFGSLLRGSY